MHLNRQELLPRGTVTSIRTSHFSSAIYESSLVLPVSVFGLVSRNVIAYVPQKEFDPSEHAY